MKIAIIGGGPAGLYAAILLRKQRPAAEITVYERNRADDTFGFGVVFSDATLDNFEKYDPPSYRRITQEFAYWDDIAVHFRGTVHRVGGNGFCGCSRRRLLLILQERARELGVSLRFETDPGTFERAGLKGLNEKQSADRMAEIFGWFLEAHPLLTNRSMWRNFPMIRSQRWVKDNMVLLGDAKATAHFSIGSGTKLAMEDAIALADAMQAAPTTEAALTLYEQGRREEVEKTQHAADVSLVWFEHVDRFWKFDPVQFAFGVMTRAKAITYDNLNLRAPDFVAQVDRAFARQVRDKGFDVDVENPLPPMFQPLRLRDMTLANRAVVSPMCMYSAQEGVPGDFHFVHYGARALGGAGLMFTEMTCVGRDARITPGCTGLWNDEQQAAWTRIVDFVHGNSTANICLQVGHAGRKGATKLMWEGMDRPLEQGGWDVLSASPIPYFPDSQVPREMDRAAMDRVRDEFVAATQRGEACGFDMLELHCAHGYLLASFISPLTNKRTDAYGGSLANRLRFPLEIFSAMRAAWPAHKPMSVRISATDWAEGGITGDDAVAIARAFAEAGVDLVDVSTGQTVRDAHPVYGRMFQTPFSDQVRNEARVATMCVGNITTADQVNTILAAGRADLVALGRPHLVDPSFTIKAAAWYGLPDIFCPPQYLPGKDQIFRNSVRDRQDFEDLKIKAKPKTRAELKLEATKPLAAE